MEAAAASMKRELETMGVLDVDEFWLMNQPFEIACHLKRELGISPSLLLYSTELLRVTCYGRGEDPPRHEIIQKTRCFIRQLNVHNWNLNFTESGYPVVVDIPANFAQGPRTGERRMGV